MTPASCWAVPCPWCAAGVGEACVDPAASTYVDAAHGWSHHARWDAWADVQQERSRREAAAGLPRSGYRLTRQQQHDGLIEAAKLRDRLTEEHERREVEREARR